MHREDGGWRTTEEGKEEESEVGRWVGRACPRGRPLTVTNGFKISSVKLAWECDAVLLTVQQRGVRLTCVLVTLCVHRPSGVARSAMPPAMDLVFVAGADTLQGQT